MDDPAPLDDADDHPPDVWPATDAVCDGGDLDCGSGLLLIIRNAMAPLDPGRVLEVRSSETSVIEDLPAWCRLVGHSLLATQPGPGRYTHYAIRKRGAAVENDLAGDLDQARDHRWRTRVRWKQGLQASVYARNHTWTVGQPASFDTEDAAASAVEHLLGALAACLAVGFQWRCSRARIEVHDLELTLSARADDILVFLGLTESGHPGLQAVEGKAYVDADAAPEVLESIWAETLRRSPVAQTVQQGAPVAVTLSKV